MAAIVATCLALGASTRALTAQSLHDVTDTSATAPAPSVGATAAMITAASLVTDKTVPQSVGTTITLTADGVGGIRPYSFKFLITMDQWAHYSVLRDWSTSPSYSWTPVAPGSYTLGIWVKSAFNRADAPEVAAALAFPISTSLTINTIGIGSVTSNPIGDPCPAFSCSAMYPVNTVVTLRATPSGGYAFAGWSPSECATGTIVMTKNTVCNAIFIQSNVGGLFPSNINLIAGYGDVLAYDPATGARWFEYNNGGGGFGERRAAWPAHLQLYPADWNGDGLTDFLAYNNVTGAWAKATNNGAGDFTYYAGVWPAGLQLYVLDLDGDGRSDVFAYTPSSGLWTRCLSTPGDGTVAVACGANGQWPAGLSLYVGDFNSDLLPDFLVYNATTGRWTLVINTGTGFRYDASGAWPAGLAFFPADYNHDGRTDLFAWNAGTGDWSLLITDLTLLPSPAPSYKFTNYPGRWAAGWTLTVGDFNGDSKADLFLYNEATGDHQVATSNGTSFTLSAIDTWSAGWKVQAAHFFGTFETDLLLYDPTSGQWYVAQTVAPNVFGYSTGFWAPGLKIIASRQTIP